jgi:hypothetical protein
MQRERFLVAVASFNYNLAPRAQQFAGLNHRQLG